MPTVISGDTGVSQVQDGAVSTADLANGAVTQAKLADGAVAFSKLLSTDWTSSLAASGYQKLPSGLIIQWGKNSTSAQPTSVSFPITFPNSVLVVSGAGYNSSSATEAICAVHSKSTTGFTFTGWVGTTVNTNGNVAFEWIAIGY